MRARVLAGRSSTLPRSPLEQGLQATKTRSTSGTADHGTCGPQKGEQDKEIDDRRYDPPRMSPSVIVTIAIVATPHTTLRSPGMPEAYAGR